MLLLLLLRSPHRLHALLLRLLLGRGGWRHPLLLHWLWLLLVLLHRCCPLHRPHRSGCSNWRLCHLLRLLLWPCTLL